MSAGVNAATRYSVIGSDTASLQESQPARLVVEHVMRACVER